MINERIIKAAIAFAQARRARAAARTAWTDYLDANYVVPTPHDPMDGDTGRHRFGTCRVEKNGDGELLFPLCDVCAGSDPLYKAYQQAAAKAGGAMRSLMRAVPVTP